MSAETYYIELHHNSAPVSRLAYEASVGNSSYMRDAITTGINWEIEGHDPLYYAAAKHKNEIAHMLIMAGSPITSSVVYIAYRFGNKSLAQELVVNKKFIDQLSTETDSKLNLAFIDGARALDVSFMKSLVATGTIDCDTTDYFHGFPDWTALHHAARACDETSIRFLLACGGHVNSRTEAQQTPLFLAGIRSRTITRTQRKRCIQLLLRHNALYAPPVPLLNRTLLQWFGRGAYLESEFV